MASYTFSNASSKMSQSLAIPTKIVEQKLLSDTSDAYKCFVQQKFSAELQAYMINYVTTISGLYSVYA